MRKDFEVFMHTLAEAGNEQQNVSAHVLESKQNYEAALVKVEQETALMMFNSFAGPNQSHANLKEAQQNLEGAHAKYIEALETADELSRMRKPHLLRMQDRVLTNFDNALKGI